MFQGFVSKRLNNLKWQFEDGDEAPKHCSRTWGPPNNTLVTQVNGSMIRPMDEDLPEPQIANSFTEHIDAKTELGFIAKTEVSGRLEVS